MRRWQAGADIVLGVRASEDNSVGLSAARGSAYWFFEKFGDYPVIPNATGFGLYTRRVVREIERLSVLVQKTGDAQEHVAMDFIRAHVIRRASVAQAGFAPPAAPQASLASTRAVPL